MPTTKAYLVEDNPIIRANLSDALRELANVQVVGSAAKALDASMWLAERSDAWDLVLVDLLLAEGSGFTVLAACRVRKPHQLVVVVSNHLNSDTRRRCLDYGADAVLDKSTEVEALLDYCATRPRP